MRSASNDTAGFSRLGALIPAVSTIAHGAGRAVFSPAELQARLGESSLSARLVGPAPGDARCGEIEAERGRGSSNQISGSVNANADKNSLAALALHGNDTSEVAPDPARATAVDNREAFAQYLAQSLGDTDPRNIGFYRKAVRLVPRNVLQDTLNRAKDARDIRTTRAKLFTHILMSEHMPKGPNKRL